MSYILEALRKAERERQLSEAPSVAEVLSVQPVKRRNWFPWLVVMLLLSLNGGLLWHFWLKGSENVKTAVPSQASGPLAKPGKKITDEAEKQANGLATRQNPVPPSISQAAELNASNALAPVKPTAEASSTPISRPIKQLPAPRENKQVEAKKSEGFNGSSATAQNIRKPARKSEPIDKALFQGNAGESSPPMDRLANEKLTFSHGESDREPREESRVPSLNQMPAEIQQNMPNIKINVLAYSSAPEERFAVINMVKYNRGEQLPGGAVLRDIEPNGVVLELNGRRFRVSHH